jgi:hypothetical protein|tara:strand:+ start:2087 stop:2275 length:189 start_codon:yes stop_codon:yes gene_type:complete
MAVIRNTIPSHRYRNSRYLRELNVRRHPVSTGWAGGVGPAEVGGVFPAPFVEGGEEVEIWEF